MATKLTVNFVPLKRNRTRIGVSFSSKSTIHFISPGDEEDDDEDFDEDDFNLDDLGEFEWDDQEYDDEENNPADE